MRHGQPDSTRSIVSGLTPARRASSALLIIAACRSTGAEAVHPGYGFAIHKGYSTPAHTAALADLGPCPEHRFSFANVRKVAAKPGIGQRCRSG